mmetsp:Transcript_119412/g.230366  ORF Transcript_119412/g.230366 Transcript_119412/m.230366 type:complete len:224 (-) Transcript_119412:1352-2023(-)
MQGSQQLRLLDRYSTSSAPDDNIASASEAAAAGAAGAGAAGLALGSRRQVLCCTGGIQCPGFKLTMTAPDNVASKPKILRRRIVLNLLTSNEGGPRGGSEGMSRSCWIRTCIFFFFFFAAGAASAASAGASSAASTGAASAASPSAAASAGAASAASTSVAASAASSASAASCSNEAAGSTLPMHGSTSTNSSKNLESGRAIRASSSACVSGLMKGTAMPVFN